MRIKFGGLSDLLLHEIINKEILKRFNEAGLEFAFPTQTILKKEI